MASKLICNTPIGVVSDSIGSNPSVLVKVYSDTQSQDQNAGVWYYGNALGNGHLQADVSIACVSI